MNDAHRLSLPLLTLLVLASGCSSKSADSAAPFTSTPTALTASPVAWNPSNVDVGTVQAVAEQDMSVLVFGTNGVQLLTAGSLASADATVTTWTTAAVLPSPDGVSTWTIGVDGTNQLQRIVTNDPPDEVTDRYGLATTDKVLGMASGGTHVAFMLDGSIALGDGTNLTRYPVAAKTIAANGTQVAVADGTAVRLFDSGKETDIALSDAQFVAFDSGGDLLAATTHALYKVTNGTAMPVYDAGTRTIHQLVGAAANVWLAVDGDLAQWTTAGVALGTGGTLAADVHLVGSGSGDVWAISGGTLFRFTAAAAASGDEATWTSTVQPVYDAVCSNCHSPPGSGKDSSHVDLSTYAMWETLKPSVYTRVVTDASMPSSMPPPGSGFTLTDPQRAAIEAWSKP